MMDAKQTNILVSIVVPAYNCEAYVGELLSDVVNQTYETLQIIVVDDGSADNTSQIVEQFARRDRRVTVVHTSNHGPSYARNIGYSLAKGDWIWFVDADDRIESYSVEQLLHSALAHNAEVAVADVVPFNEQGALPRTDCLSKPFPTVAQSDGIGLLAYVLQDALGGYAWQFFISSAALRELAKDTPLFPNGINLYEDVVFAIALAMQVGKAAYVHMPLYRYRQIPTSAAHHVTSKSFHEGLKAIEIVKHFDVPQYLIPYRNDCICGLYLYLLGCEVNNGVTTALKSDAKKELLGFMKHNAQGLSSTVRTKAMLVRMNMLMPALRLIRLARSFPCRIKLSTRSESRSTPKV